MAKTYDRLEDALRSRERVRVLSLSVPRKTSLDADLSAFPQLESLTLNAPKLQRLPAGLFECRNLRKLALHGTPLPALPRDIGRLESLEELWINSAGLSRLPKELGRLKRLTYLSLDFNRLASLPDVFDQLPRLQTLTCIENRRLTSLPPSLGKAKALRWLQLDTCPLPRTPLLEQLSARVPAFFCRFQDLSHQRKPKASARVRRANLASLLQALRDSNARDGISQQVHPARSVPTRIPTLAPGKLQPTSPMLSERFRFAGRWVGAWLDQTWLAPEEMQPLAPALRRQVALRREHWTDSVVATLPEDRLTLFGVDRRNGDETYLVWTPGKTEPAVVYFAGASETRHRDLRELLQAISAA